MGGKSSRPRAPDYRGAAEEQAQASKEITREQTWANRPNITTPWGSITWEAAPGIDPGTGQPITQWEQNLALTPEQQQALDYQQTLQAQRSELAGGLYDRMADEYAAPPDWSGYEDLRSVDPTIGDLPAGGTAPGLTGMVDLPGSIERAGPDLDPASRYYGEAGDAIYGQFERRMEPRFEQQSAALDTQLRNQGLQPGDEAYDYQMSQMRQSQEDARQGAQYQATIGAGAEAQRMLGMDAATRAQMFGENVTGGQFDLARAGQQYGMMSDQFSQGMAGARFAESQRGRALQEDMARFNQDLAAAGYTGQMRQQQIAEEMQRRGYTLNEINAILTGQQVAQPTMPGFATATKAETPQYLNAAGMQYQSDLDAYNADQMSNQGLMGGLTSMGAAYLGRPPRV